MTSRRSHGGALCALVLTLVAASPLFGADARKRPVAHPSSVKISISGTVTDANTGLPVKGASISSTEGAAVSDDAGHFTVNALKGGLVTAARVGYVSVQRQATEGTPVNFALPQTPSVIVKLSSGETVSFDYSSVKFGYVNIFSYTAEEFINLCKTGNPQWSANKSEFKKITGPAHAVTSSCCDRGPVMAIDVALKSGETTTAYLNDSCFGYVVDILGVERSTATARYIHLSDVTDVTFP